MEAKNKMPRNKFNKNCARLNEEIHKTTVIHKEMISPSRDTSIFMDGKFHYYKHVNFLKINFTFKAISIRIPSGYFKPDKFILSK